MSTGNTYVVNDGSTGFAIQTGGSGGFGQHQRPLARLSDGIGGTGANMAALGLSGTGTSLTVGTADIGYDGGTGVGQRRAAARLTTTGAVRGFERRRRLHRGYAGGQQAARTLLQWGHV